jgi:hypothetical protein
MNKEAFEELFAKRVSDRLASLGFARKGKSLSLFDENLTISLIRLGGRLNLPGSISHVLCVRHSFLRDRTERVPTAVPPEVFDYPYKLKPIEDAGRDRRYRPQNLNYDYERLRWEDVDEASVGRKLDQLVSSVENQYLPWARALSPTVAKAEITEFGEDAWCERMWLEDYDARLAV